MSFVSSATSTDTAGVLLADEILRTRAFLWLSGSLGVVGAVASLLFDGSEVFGRAFRVSVVLLVLGYVALGIHIRKPENYSPTKALGVVAVCNLGGVVASFFYGVFSPCPMILMIPIAFFGLSRSGVAATVAYATAAGAMLVGTLAIVVGLVEDPGLVRATELDPLRQVLYALLVQVVYAVAFVLARFSRRATRTAVRQMEVALRAVEDREARLDEAHERLGQVLGGSSRGPLSGRSYGRWTLGSLLGRGAMGQVYASGDAAVKVLNPSAATQPTSLMLFQREAKALQSVNAENVVRFLDHGTEPGPFLVMERVYGETLEDRLRHQNALSVDALRSFVEQVCRGLEAAHAVGVVHRDLKPSNVVAARIGDRQEAWKLFDFGVAKDLGDEASLTMGMVLGTPAYMSPEQLRGGAVDARADVYSLAATVYRALTGRRPFVGRTYQKMVGHALRDRPVRPSAFVAVPKQIELVLALGLARDRDDRPHSAMAFYRAFEAAAARNLDDKTKERGRIQLADWPFKPSASSAGSRSSPAPGHKQTELL